VNEEAKRQVAKDTAFAVVALNRGATREEVAARLTNERSTGQAAHKRPIGYAESIVARAEKALEAQQQQAIHQGYGIGL
jgi:hypothetical protein